MFPMELWQKSVTLATFFSFFLKKNNHISIMFYVRFSRISADELSKTNPFLEMERRAGKGKEQGGSFGNG